MVDELGVVIQLFEDEDVDLFQDEGEVLIARLFRMNKQKIFDQIVPNFVALGVDGNVTLGEEIKSLCNVIDYVDD
ncbi:hypothetical protein M569_02176 [Genlisea aurea]|uniref:Uncharacterized protein n=1 Tax=Genlisea aurea TaxID=192259 RepID=S8D583_9LAMI|nr:hypothetical protein M569_02176 [Genlisea aurea]